MGSSSYKGETRGICDNFVGFSDKGKTLETM
jgi:hypothetical protein